MRKLIALALLVPTLAWGAIWLTVKEPTASVAGPNDHFDTEITRLGGSVLQKCACRSTADKTTFVLGANQGDISYNATLDGMEFNMPATGRDSSMSGIMDITHTEVNSGNIWFQWEECWPDGATTAWVDYDHTGYYDTIGKFIRIRRENESEVRTFDIQRYKPDVGGTGTAFTNQGAAWFSAVRQYGTDQLACGDDEIRAIVADSGCPNTNRQPGGDTEADRFLRPYQANEHPAVSHDGIFGPALILPNTWVRTTMHVNITADTMRWWQGDEANDVVIVMDDPVTPGNGFDLQTAAANPLVFDNFRIGPNSSGATGDDPNGNGDMQVLYRNIIISTAEINRGTGSDGGRPSGTCE